MDKSGKTVTVLLAVLILFSLSSSALTYYYYGVEKNKRRALESDFAKLQEVKKQLEDKVGEYKINIQDLNNKLAESAMKLDDATAKLNTEKNARKQVVIEKEQLQSERDNLVEELDAKTGALKELESRLSNARKDITTLRQQVDNMQGTGVSPADVAQLETIELGKIVVAARDFSKGKIIIVNREHNFAVINSGVDDSISIGQVLSVYRDKKFIGKIRLVKIRKDFSVCDALSPTDINSLKEGDVVQISSK